MQTIWKFLTDFGDTAVTVPLAILTTGFLFLARQNRLAIGWALVIAGCAAAIGSLKLALRVCGHPLAEPALSSPSGHTAMSIAVYGGLAVVVGSTLGPAARAALFAAAAVFTISIAASRAIIGYHSPIEVVVGFGVGLGALAAMIAVTARYRPTRLPLGWLVGGALIVFLIFHGTRWPAEQAIHRIARWLDLLRPYCR